MGHVGSYLQHAVFLVAACKLLVAACKLLVATCMWDLVPQPGIEPRPPALGAWSLTHWTTREVPLCIFWITVPCQMCLLEIFFPILWIVFSSLDSVLCRAEIFNFNEVYLISYFFHRSCLWFKSDYHTQRYLDFFFLCVIFYKFYSLAVYI